MQSTELSQMISEFESLNLKEIDDVNELVDKFVKILEAAAKTSLQLVNIKKKSRQRHSNLV